MKKATILLIMNLSSIILSIGAVAMAFNGKPNWGWFLVGALLLYSYPKTVE